jgi:hypothetical protein
MYLTDFRANTLQDLINQLKQDLFQAGNWFNGEDFNLRVQLKVFNTEQMSHAVFAFRRYGDAAIRPRYVLLREHQRTIGVKMCKFFQPAKDSPLVARKTPVSCDSRCPQQG